MITGLQLALAGGALLGLSIALLVWRLAPADPDLGDALDRLSPTRAHHLTPSPAAGDLQDRLGVWAIKRLPPAAWARTPTRELALLRIPTHRFYGQKIFYALGGLVIPPLLAALFTLLGLGLPPFIPAVAALALAVLMFFAPDIDARAAATKARAEFTRALGAYIDLVALERAAGSGPRQAMEVAAAVGDSWVFQRLDEELSRSRWSGVAPWEALRELADELGLPELSDLADIMRLSGEEGAQVYTNLRARSAALRSATLNDELAKANATNERMWVPASLLGITFMAILIAPSLLRVLGGGA